MPVTPGDWPCQRASRRNSTLRHIALRRGVRARPCPGQEIRPGRSEILVAGESKILVSSISPVDIERSCPLLAQAGHPPAPRFGPQKPSWGMKIRFPARHPATDEKQDLSFRATCKVGGRDALPSLCGWFPKLVLPNPGPRRGRPDFQVQSIPSCESLSTSWLRIHVKPCNRRLSSWTYLQSTTI